MYHNTHESQASRAISMFATTEVVGNRTLATLDQYHQASLLHCYNFSTLMASMVIIQTVVFSLSTQLVLEESEMSTSLQNCPKRLYFL